jgi:hypothetical protein
MKAEWAAQSFFRDDGNGHYHLYRRNAATRPGHRWFGSDQPVLIVALAGLGMVLLQVTVACHPPGPEAARG